MAESYKELYRSNKNRMFGGVCGGLGEYLNIDPTIIRLVAALLTICGVGTPILIYFIMLLIVPEEPASPQPEAQLPPVE
ncbi:MAG: PspC domain-containing protein [Chloroflexota bacterium]